MKKVKYDDKTGEINCNCPRNRTHQNLRNGCYEFIPCGAWCPHFDGPNDTQSCMGITILQTITITCSGQPVMLEVEE